MIGMLEKVKSSTISAVLYQEEEQELFIQFVGGKVYRYLEVSQEQYEHLMEAESKGSYFNLYIKGKYPAHQVKGFPIPILPEPTAWDVEILGDLTRSLQLHSRGLDEIEDKRTQDRITALQRVIEYVMSGLKT